MRIDYKIGVVPSVEEIVTVYKSAGLDRPVSDAERIGKMYEHSNLVVSAWVGHQLVGVARSLTDFCYCCYLSDLAVAEEYKRMGIGENLIDLTKAELGDKVTFILLAASGAMEYYPKVGFETIHNGFIIKRKQ